MGVIYSSRDDLRKGGLLPDNFPKIYLERVGF